MKGIELPINALIIITVAVLVLLGIVALWMSSWGGGSRGVTIEAAKSAACSELMRYYAGCTAKDPKDIPISNFDANRNGNNGDAGTFDSTKTVCGTSADAANGDNLQTLCYCYYNAKTASACRITCGCGG
jgi:hypothetical protein